MTTLIEAGIKGGNAYKHQWTDEERAIVREGYKGTNVSAIQIAELLSYTSGDKITLYAVKGQIQKMGISFFRHARWTPAEIDKLCELITKYPIYRVAEIMKRSKNSIRVKATRMGYSARIKDGWFSKKDVCEILGVDHKKDQRWIDLGLLEASWHTHREPQKNGMAMWRITTSDLRRFIMKYHQELTARNVDLGTIVYLLTGEL